MENVFLFLLIVFLVLLIVFFKGFLFVFRFIFALMDQVLCSQ